MDIRRHIRDKPGAAGTLAAALCLGALALLAWEFHASRSNPQRAFAGKTFFSDDDGQTWFLDDESKIPPFDHNGKPACRAAVYRCGMARPFVAYLQKYTESQLAHLDSMRKSFIKSHPNDPLPTGQLEMLPMAVKKPGGSKWISPPSSDRTSDPAAYYNAMRPVCPDGSTDVTEVLPSDSDALPG